MATYPSMTDQDPFAGGGKTPSLSWRGLAVGSVFVLEVLEPATLVQSRNFDTNEPDYWDEAKTQPKMSAVVKVRVRSGPHSVGEERSIWAQKPSSMFAAIAHAQVQSGARLAPGGVLSVRFDSETPHENKRFNAIKNYVAKYEPPAASDAFAAPTQQQAYAPAQQPTPTGWPAQQPVQPTLPGTPPAQSRW